MKMCGDQQCVNKDCKRHQIHCRPMLEYPLSWGMLAGLKECEGKKVKEKK